MHAASRIGQRAVRVDAGESVQRVAAQPTSVRFFLSLAIVSVVATGLVWIAMPETKPGKYLD
jgi:hypothetical protein